VGSEGTKVEGSEVENGGMEYGGETKDLREHSVGIRGVRIGHISKLGRLLGRGVKLVL
jgi:hypothetical protein